uniref:Uncharacterized protein n=1 Tax=Tetranychus urticae TaxID=32264 RepID=A0A158P4T9_TETUR
MFIQLLIWFFKFWLLIELTYSFRTFKHDIASYYKTHDSVFLTNPTSHTTSYGIYVAGKTIIIDIPKSVVNVSEILDWKVVSLIKNRLMFVHKNKPYILIDQQRIKQMNYSGELSESIIAFGDNEALHVPTIFNPNLTKPVHKWNYIELLYFDDQNEKVSVKRSLPWLKDDDWKFIKEWNMTDYIHFDNKLYLLIKRSISNANSQSVTQEISIVQLCLDKGSELISSAVEVHFTRPEFITNQLIDLIFVFLFAPHETEYDRYQLHTTQLESSSNTKIYDIYFLRDFVLLFEETAIECTSASGESTLLRHYLRSEVGGCKKTSQKSCSTMENIVPSRNVSDFFTGTFYNFSLFDTRATFVHKIHFVTLPYPHFKKIILMHTIPLELTAFCEYLSSQCLYLFLINSNFFEMSSQAEFHINKYPFGFNFIDKETNKILFIPIGMCSHLKTCTQCIMYGLYYNCIWSNFFCVPDTQPKNKIALTVDHCFKVIQIFPLIFNSSSPTNLTIKLDKTLDFTDSQEQLVIQAGDNHCTDITRDAFSINCTLNLLESGKFNIEVSLQNDKYADAVMLRAVSVDQVYISVSNGRYIFVLLSLGLVIGFILLLGFKANNKKDSSEFLEFRKAAKVIRKVSKTMISKTMSDERIKSFQEPKSTTEMSVPSISKSTR